MIDDNESHTVQFIHDSCMCSSVTFNDCKTATETWMSQITVWGHWWMPPWVCQCCQSVASSSCPPLVSSAASSCGWCHHRTANTVSLLLQVHQTQQSYTTVLHPPQSNKHQTTHLTQQSYIQRKKTKISYYLVQSPVLRTVTALHIPPI